MLGRIKRVLVAIIGTGAVLLWLASAGLWVRSYWRGDVMTFDRARDDSASRPSEFPLYQYSSLALVSGDGGIGFVVRQAARFNDPFARERRWDVFGTPAYPQPATPPAAPIFGGAPARRVFVAAADLPERTIPDPLRTFDGNSNIANSTFRGATTAPAGYTAAVAKYYAAANKLSPATASAIASPNSAIPPPSPAITANRFMIYRVGTPIGQVLPTGDLTRVLILPYWAILAPLTLVTLLPMWRLMSSVRRWRWAARGCCPACGYDLRATPDRCPECGTAVKPC